MKPPLAERLEKIVAQGRFDRALALLERLDPTKAASLLMAIPFSEQQKLFGALPVPLAARLAGQFPYYHAYVLLQSRPVKELRLIIDEMLPGERMQFLDELPEEAWQPIMDAVAGGNRLRPPAKSAPPSPWRRPPQLLPSRRRRSPSSRPSGSKRAMCSRTAARCRSLPPWTSP